MVNVLVGVVGHEQRRGAAHELADNVWASACRIDDGTLQIEGNHLRVLHELWLTSCFVTEPEDRLDGFCVVLEDDAQPIPQFREHLDAALEHAPAPIVGLYLGTGNPSGEVARQARQAVFTALDHTKDAWIMADCLLNTVGYAVRADLVDEMCSDIAQRSGEMPLRITRWAQFAGHDICYTVPSLVDHADGNPINPCPPGRLERKAWAVGTPVAGWDTGSVRLGHCPQWSIDA